MSRGGKVVEDSATGEMRESTAGTFNKGAAKDFFSDEAVKTNKKNMRKLRVGGKGLVRAETTRKGGIDFRHESDPEKEGLGGGGGKYADAIAYEDSERRIDQLAGNIKAGMGYAGGTRDRNESMQSKAKASMSAALKDNAGDIQIALDAASDEDKKEYQNIFSKYCKTSTLLNAEASADNLSLKLKKGKNDNRIHFLNSLIKKINGINYDFYGFETFQVLAQSFGIDQTEESEKLILSMVGFRLSETLSDHGHVSRGICQKTAGYLETVEEWTKIGGTPITGLNSSGTQLSLSGSEIVSMNIWGFPVSIFSLLETEFIKFLMSLNQEDFL